MSNVLQVNFAEIEFLGTEPKFRRRDSVDWEQSLFFFRFSEGSTRALPSSAFSHARGHLRVSRVSLYGLKKTRETARSLVVVCLRLPAP